MDKELTPKEKSEQRRQRILVLKGEAFDIGRRQALLKREFDAIENIRIEKINEIVKLEKEDLLEAKEQG